MFNFESWPTFYGSLTLQLFVKFLVFNRVS